jgi:hypothetical protein
MHFDTPLKDSGKVSQIYKDSWELSYVARAAIDCTSGNTIRASNNFVPDKLKTPSYFRT